MTWLVMGASLILAIIHLFVGRLHFLEYIPRSRVFSVAGGISVSYVFLHILPELDKLQESVKEELNTGIFSNLSQHVYITALLGLIVFYAIEKFVKKSQESNKEHAGENTHRLDAFWPHVALFFFYNAIIGYLLVYQSEEDGWAGVLLLMMVMAPHFLVIDFGLRHHHEETYDKYGRWILAAAIVIGAALGSFAPMPDAVFALLFAFLSGAIVLNVMKEELPEENKSSLGAFISGAAGYVILLELLLML